MATTRHEVVSTLYDKGVTPLHPKYSFHVETFLVKKFCIDQTNLSNANESKLRDVASRFSSKAKKFCLENKKHVPTMLKKKDKWFSEVIENPIVLEQPEQPKSKSNLNNQNQNQIQKKNQADQKSPKEVQRKRTIMIQNKGHNLTKQETWQRTILLKNYWLLL